MKIISILEEGKVQLQGQQAVEAMKTAHQIELSSLNDDHQRRFE